MNKERDVGYDFIRFSAMIMILLHHFYTTCRDMHFRFPPFLKQILHEFPFEFAGGVLPCFLFYRVLCS
jgi:hypothetical protein